MYTCTTHQDYESQTNKQTNKQTNERIEHSPGYSIFCHLRLKQKHTSRIIKKSVMVCSHYPTPRLIQRQIKNGLCRFVWRCSYCTGSDIPISTKIPLSSVLIYQYLCLSRFRAVWTHYWIDSKLASMLRFNILSMNGNGTHLLRWRQCDHRHNVKRRNLVLRAFPLHKQSYPTALLKVYFGDCAGTLGPVFYE